MFQEDQAIKYPPFPIFGDYINCMENVHNFINLQEIKNLDGLKTLKELYLGKNKITKIQNLNDLTNLQILILQSNRLTKIENLEQLTNLEQLYLSENGISVMENLDNQVKLQTLDLAMNRITVIDNVRHMSCLEELWVSWYIFNFLHYYSSNFIFLFFPPSLTINSSFTSKFVLDYF